MNTSSAFARVIGITRSLSPLSFDRGHEKDEDQAAEAAESASVTVADATDGAPASESNFIGPKWLDETATAEGLGFSDATRSDDPAELPADIDDPFGFSAHAAPPTDAGVVVQFPALAQITVVSEAQVATVTHGEAGDAFPKNPGNDLIDAIQNDVAALLASEQQRTKAAVEEEDEGALGDEGVTEIAAAAEEETAEEPTLALLSELNRMWQADPNVSGNRWP